MLAADFIARWRSADLTERAAAQSHFRDLCELLGEEPSTTAGPERRVVRLREGRDEDDRRRRLGRCLEARLFWLGIQEQGKNLRAAFAQLQRYAPALENPPLLVVCDLARFEIHTNWTNTVSHTYEIGLDELAEALYAYVLEHVRPVRLQNRREAFATYWWGTC